MPLSSMLSRRIQHILYKNTIPGILGIHQHMGDGSNNFSILEHRTPR